MAEERIQKLIARSGLCSRRDAERLIEEGRVTVTVGSPPQETRPTERRPYQDRRQAPPPAGAASLPAAVQAARVMTTCDDPEERTTVIDLVRPRIRERLFPVGRLDYHSEGLIMLTNDGELAERVSHPRHGVVREYLVKIRGDLDDQQLRRADGWYRDRGPPGRPKAAGSSATRGPSSWWRIQVTEGRTHEVRELFFRAGHHVQRLRRTGIGPMRDDRLGPGDLRELSEDEVLVLKGERAGRQQRRRQSSRGIRGKDTAPKRTGASTRKKS